MAVTNRNLVALKGIENSIKQQPKDLLIVCRCYDNRQVVIHCDCDFIGHVGFVFNDFIVGISEAFYKREIFKRVRLELVPDHLICMTQFFIG